MKSRRLIVGIALILIVFLGGLLAPYLTQHDPKTMRLAERFAKPSSTHLLGLDQNGVDVLAQILFGARVSLLVSLSVVLFSSSFGLLLGSLAGYFGAWIDHLVMRTLDMLHAFPGFLLALALIAVIGPSVPHLIFALCLTGWTGYARLVRGEVLHLKTREYVTAALAVGAPAWRVLLFHVWPNLLGLLVVQMTFGMAGTIVTESGLSFLGLGAPPDVPTWGALLNSGRRYLVEAPHLSIFAGLAIVTLVLGFNLLGDGLRAQINPKAQ